MDYTSDYDSKYGKILLASDGEAITGLWFYGQKYFAATLSNEHIKKELPVFQDTYKWLNMYFSGKEPEYSVPIAPRGSDFRKIVWQILCDIPYSKVATYKNVAEKAAQILGISTMSAQAVGGAVGHNPISILIPCHRVIGANGSLTGYAAGVEIKRRLLELERR